MRKIMTLVDIIVIVTMTSVFFGVLDTKPPISPATTTPHTQEKAKC